MCDEKHVSTKICSCCGNELPVTAFDRHGKSKDGYSHICRAYKAEQNGTNTDLAKFTPRELINELRARGYRGKLTFTQTYEINV